MADSSRHLTTALKAGLWSIAVQLPFMVMVNFGVHTNIGAVGYIFYYPWILVLDYLSGSSAKSWENNIPLFEAALFGLQSLFLSLFIFMVMILKKRFNSDSTRIVH